MFGEMVGVGISADGKRVIKAHRFSLIASVFWAKWV